MKSLAKSPPQAPQEKPDPYTSVDCGKVIEAAEKAVQAQKEQVEVRDLRIKQDEDQLSAVSKEYESLQKSSNAWYKSPYLFLIMGLGVGLYLGKK